jgi:hypothetical protein
MSTAASRQPSRGRRVALGVLAAMIVLGIVHGVRARFGDDGPSIAAVPQSRQAPAAASVSPSPVPPPTPMPDLVGMAHSAAAEVPELSERDVQYRDLAPTNRYASRYGRWTVVATLPAAGSPLPGKGSEQRVRLYVLRPAEVAWYAAHPRMPKLPKGVPARSVLRRSGALHGMADLVVFRWAKGHAPRGAHRDVNLPTYGDPDRLDLQVDPPAERRARQQLKYASEYEPGIVVVNSIPRAGKPVRKGRVLVVTVRAVPSGASSSSGGSGYVVPYHSDDDDGNIPGWLCPTRFC